jgi:hypothetical protein
MDVLLNKVFVPVQICEWLPHFLCVHGRKHCLTCPHRLPANAPLLSQNCLGCLGCNFRVLVCASVTTLHVQV